MVGALVGQREVHSGPRGRIMALDSAYDINASNRGRDVVVNASYCGMLPTRFIGAERPRAVISVDCGVGPEGNGIAGLWYLEALGIPAATVDVMSMLLGDGMDMYENGRISFVNRLAFDCGVKVGMTVREAARILLETDTVAQKPEDITNRTVMEEGPDGRLIVCTDSIAFGIPGEDARNVLVTAGHTGRRAVPNILRCRPFGLIASDGGMGRDNSGAAGIYEVESEGIAAAVTDARRARMGDGLSTYRDGIISAANSVAVRAGVRIGMPAAEAARLIVRREVG